MKSWKDFFYNFFDDDQDKSLGPELAVNGSFTVNADWGMGAGISITGGILRFLNVENGIAADQGGFINGKRFRIALDVIFYSDGAILVALGNEVGRVYNAEGSYSFEVFLRSGVQLWIVAQGVTNLNVDNVSVREIL
jgi:hypothetical protein